MTEDLTSAKILADSIYEGGPRLTTVEVTFPRFVLAEFNTHCSLCLAGDSVLEFDMPTGGASGHRRVFKMRLDEFADKWHNGAASRPNKRKADGSHGYNRQPIRDRLANMRIRQLDETTGLIQTSTVEDCTISGVKRAYEVRAGKFRVAGSADHRIYTPEGWRTIGELAPGDLIVVRRWGKRDEDLLDPVRLKKIGGQWRSVWQRHKRAELLELYGGCVRCGSTDDLHVHHLVSVHVDASKAFDDDNVTLLCGDHHVDEHRVQPWLRGGTYLYGDTVPVDQVSFRGHEMTYDLQIAGKYPNFVANGVIVHNSRNSASSRAIPVEKQIERVQANPFVPKVFPINKAGMSATEYTRPGTVAHETAELIWLEARDSAVMAAEAMAYNKIHKQIASRLLEPFMWHTVIATGTGIAWGWFFDLRVHPAAQPEICTAAEAIQAAIKDSVPRQLMQDEWHLPLVREDERQHHQMVNSDLLPWISASRCARVSYDRQHDTESIDKTLERANMLATSRHLSPFEHPVRPARNLNEEAKFAGWCQLRKLLEQGAVLPS